MTALPSTGTGTFPSTSEYVAFDLETTGLSSLHDTIIEIGAAIMKGNEVLEHVPDLR